MIYRKGMVNAYLFLVNFEISGGQISMTGAEIFLKINLRRVLYLNKSNISSSDDTRLAPIWCV